MKNASLLIISALFSFLLLIFRRELLDEKPFLTEAGPAVFDALYDTVIRQVSYIVKPPISSHNVVSISVLIKDSVNVLIGVPSRSFHLDKVLLASVFTQAVRQMNDKETIHPT